MPNYLGVDLGGTKLSCVLADQDGVFLHQKTYPSPYRVTSNRSADGSPEVYIETILTDIPIEVRVAEYLARTEAEFMKDAGNRSVAAKGYSLCGKTWVHDGKIRMIGGNTPSRLGTDPGDGKIGILIADQADHVVAANDGNAAAHAQAIFYKSVEGIAPEETGYMILGTGFGFGVPGYQAMTEIGHIPVNLMPKTLWQSCGCTEGHKTACTENFVSGRGMQVTAERLLELGPEALKPLSQQLASVVEGLDLEQAVARSRLRKGHADAQTVMGLAGKGEDDLALFVAELAAQITAGAAVTAASLFGLRRIGIGETIALSNPWHVERIARIAANYIAGNYLLRPTFSVELTPIANPAKFGALSLVVPEARYDAWSDKMK